ncbi:MAG: ATP synthase F1 subunit gamma [candidate division Zixibacteria bacterium]|nr:ATP synthase F1 subunit gamma [candidate division Zixibacteria bacterium]
MATLRDVEKRIRTVKSTRRITKAMEMVAAAKLRRSQAAVEQAKPYAQKLDEMLSHLAVGSTAEIAHPYFEERPVKKRTLVVIVSDRGLCGSFNSNLLRKTDKWLKEHQDTDIEMVVVGKRANDYYKTRFDNIVEYYGDWGGAIDYGRARGLVTYLTNRFVTGETDEIDLAFTRFVSLVRYNIEIEKYLPVPRPEASGQESSSVSDYIFEPSSEEIYGQLMPSYANTKMITALLESFASEHGSRMMAMGNATRNAGDMVDSLTLEYNKARQAQITKELLEVVSGAEALAG